MKKIIVLAMVVFFGFAVGCTSKNEISAVWGVNSVKKPVVKSIAKLNGKNELTLYIYTFDAKDTYPSADAYKPNDFFMEARVALEPDKEIKAGEYKGEVLSLVLHTKDMNVLIGKQNSAIVIKNMGGGKIAGELKLDDGSAKVSGPFAMELK